MFCSCCGNEIPDNSISCQYCGMPISNNKPLDSGNIWFCFLGYCVPIAGLILYFVWKDQKPKNAKRCIQGFLISIILSIIIYILYFLFIMIFLYLGFSL